MTLTRTSLALGALLSATSALAGLPVPPGVSEQPLTLDRVFASPSLTGQAPRGVKLSPNGRILTELRNRADDRERYDLWAVDTSTGQARMLVDSQKVGTGAALSEAEKMQLERKRLGGLKGILDYGWTPDSKAILVPLDGDLYLASLDGKVTRLTNSKDGELNPAISEKGNYVSFVSGQKLWVGKVGAKPKAITPGGGTIHYGEAEFVAQEELDRFTGYWWNPDDTRIAVEWYDESNVKVVTRTSIGAEETTTFEQRYPAAGTPNIVPHLEIISPDGGRKVAADLGPDKDIYLARVDWAKDGKTLYAQILNRVQDRLDMRAIDPVTGKSRVLFSERAAPGHWINLADYKWLDDGSLIWVSERTGLAQLYRFDRGQWTKLTSLAGPVAGIAGVNQATGSVYFESNAEDPLAQQVYRTSYRTASPPVRLTDPAFVNGASMDKKGTRLIVGRSSATQPAQSYLADGDGKRIAWIAENRLDASHPYAPYLAAHQLARNGSIKGPGGDTLYYKLITPPNMKPGQRYPVFFEHYGGPHSQTVTKGFENPLTEYLVQQGYVYFEIDNRGSANRGVAFEKPIYHAMGSVEVADQKAGADFVKTLPFVDPSRVAIYGWSYGGYMTLKMLETNPGTYAAGIAGAPVTRWELYDTAYTERYMGDPRQVPQAYAASDAVEQSLGIRDPLFVIHGLSDDNVVFPNSSALFAKMQGAAVPFEMAVYPGYTHRVAGPKVSVSVWQGILNFLKRNGVGPGPR
ncbi:DPP IV N-terminal domain-containing protein [Sphingomonas sp. ASV193]|uniref:S9 family peptidase n=1 Tax=Sphingomonas sp. ASV193 TaxID=3144405 RepID=UPI0032E9026E